MHCAASTRSGRVHPPTWGLVTCSFQITLGRTCCCCVSNDCALAAADAAAAAVDVGAVYMRRCRWSSISCLICGVCGSLSCCLILSSCTCRHLSLHPSRTPAWWRHHHHRRQKVILLSSSSSSPSSSSSSSFSSSFSFSSSSSFASCLDDSMEMAPLRTVESSL